MRKTSHFSHLSDEDLLNEMVKNEDAFTYIYEKHKDYSLKFMMKMGGEYDDTLDIYQNAVIVLYEKVKNGNFILINGSSIQTYLNSICRNQLLTILKHPAPVKFDDYDNNITDWYEDVEEISTTRIKKILNEIDNMKTNGDKCYERLKLKYYDNKNMEEIALDLGLKNSAVARNMVARCRDELRIRLIGN